MSDAGDDDRTFIYDSNDTFQSAASPITMAEFEAPRLDHASDDGDTSRHRHPNDAALVQFNVTTDVVPTVTT